MRLIFDLDGTLYDTFPRVEKIYRQLKYEWGLPQQDAAEYKRHFQSSNWQELYLQLGFAQETVDAAIARFEQLEREESEGPPLIPGARDVLLQTFMHYDLENVFFLTNRPRKGVENIFLRDGLTKCLPHVLNPREGKTKELVSLSKKRNLAPDAQEEVIYIGDLVSDGTACKEAREKGAKNLRFWAMTHEYGFNHPEDVQSFTRQNPDFTREVASLQLLVHYLAGS